MTTTSKVGDRLAEPPAPELLQYLYTPSRADSYPQQFDFMSAVNKAHVVMLHRQGIIAPEVARPLLAALVEVEGRGFAGLDFDPEREDLYFNYEHAVIEVTGPQIGGQMHTGRSRNDIGATMVRMRTRAVLLDLIDEAVRMRSALLDRAAEHKGTVFPGYTHLQPAQPTTLGHYFAAVEAGLARDTRRLFAALETTARCPLGAAAFAGTGFPIDRSLTAELLGFEAVAENTLDAVASRDYLLEALAATTIMAGTLSRHTQDLYVWYSQEFALIDFRDRVSGTSSIMPQKKNPVLLENVKGRTAHQLGAFTSAVAGIRNTNYTNVIDANRIGFDPGWQALEELRVSLVLARLAVENLIVNEERALRHCFTDFSTVTQLADTLVAKCGISFRQAHEVVGGAVRRVIERGGNAADMELADVTSVARELLGVDLELEPAEFTRAMDPRVGVQVRAHVGGPAPEAVGETIERSRQDLGRDAERVTAARSVLAAAHAALNREVRAVLGR